MKILISGGHFTPALAVIQALPKDAELLVVGRKHVFEGDSALSFEYTICEKLGIPFKSIKTGRFQRKFTKKTLLSFLKIPVGLAQSLAIISEFKPDVVFSCGGYISLPIVVAAKLRKIPIVIHEQTQHAGLANKLVGKYAHTVCITFESSRKYFSGANVVVTGNPIRKEVFEIGKPLIDLSNQKLIYITGGSSGSHFINKTVTAILKPLLEKFVVIHQTGSTSQYKDYEKLIGYKKSLPDKLSKKYIIREFIYPNEIGWILKNASFVIGRSGINTVYELLALGVVSFLIPLPHGQAKEQYENAKLVHTLGMGEYMDQENVTAQNLLDSINNIIDNLAVYQKNIPQAKKIALPDADKRIASIIQSIYENKKESKKDKVS